ncbi:MAG TPA: DUF1801 domain-containing protein [Candidatus Limnocylindrales bacterium]|nr:DUF1801 domain-containing protein [Candidatus Limnocylindrales bacterium]
MSPARITHADVPAYIAAAPKQARPLLRQLRRVIRAAAPKAVEKISYGIPFYEYKGRLIYFAGYERHVALYAAWPKDPKYTKQLERYRASKATVRFNIDEPLPLALITKVVKARVKENEAKA